MAPRTSGKLSLVGKGCVFANCQSIGKKLSPDSGITFFQFAKPCKDFINEEIACVTNGVEVRSHMPKNCVQCSKALRWIRLACRADNRFKQLSDITKNTFVCSRHFVDDAPTEQNPDPMPAHMSASDCDRQCGRKRQVTKDGENGLDFGCQIPEREVDKLDFGCQMPEREESNDLSIATLTSLAREYVTCGWATNINDENVNFIKYDTHTFSYVIAVQLCHFNGQWMCSVFVHGQPIPIKTDVFAEASTITTIHSLKDFLWLISNLHICNGITNTNLLHKYQQHKHKGGKLCAWSNAVRAARCKLLTHGQRCSKCLKYESTLRSFYKRQTQTKCRSKCNNRYLTVGELVEKVEKYKKTATIVNCTNKRLKEKIRSLLKSGNAICDGTVMT